MAKYTNSQTNARYAFVNASASGNTAVVAAQGAGVQIRVLSFVIVTTAAQTVNVVEGAATFVIDLTAATFAYTAQSVQLAQSMAMSAASLAMTAGAVAMTQAVSLTAATMTFLGKAIQNRLTIGLAAAAIGFTAWALDVTGAIASAVARMMMLMGVGS